ncbi:hypothetical protein PYCC9005_003809 [Savitreella phatthalungensis]
MNFAAQTHDLGRVPETDYVVSHGGNFLLGPIILLIDADTRIPEDCFLDAVKEFAESPEVAILQHPSGVLRVMNNYWENALAHFTQNNYFSTRYIVAAGDATPFFGHNAFLRSEAIDSLAVTDSDGTRRWWSERHVSEDFEMALKLQSTGYILRMAGYSNYDFKEGVCLSVYDEISRWEKYAYGISELVFRPIRQWHHGPLTPLFCQFISSSSDLSAKCSSLFYMGTYFGLAYAWPFSLLNYIALGFWREEIGSYFVSAPADSNQRDGDLRAERCCCRYAGTISLRRDELVARACKFYSSIVRDHSVLPGTQSPRGRLYAASSLRPTHVLGRNGQIGHSDDFAS